MTKSTTTSTGGGFIVQGVPFGAYTVRVNLDTYQPVTQSGTISGDLQLAISLTRVTLSLSGTWAVGTVTTTNLNTGNSFSVPIIAANVTHSGTAINATIQYDTGGFTPAVATITGTLSDTYPGATLSGTLSVSEPSTTGGFLCTASAPLSGKATTSNTVTFSAAEKLNYLPRCAGSRFPYSITLTR